MEISSRESLKPNTPVALINLHLRDYSTKIKTRISLTWLLCQTNAQEKAAPYFWPCWAQPCPQQLLWPQKCPEQWHRIVLLRIPQGRGTMGPGSALKLPGFVVHEVIQAQSRSQDPTRYWSYWYPKGFDPFIGTQLSPGWWMWSGLEWVIPKLPAFFSSSGTTKTEHAEQQWRAEISCSLG